MSEVNTSLTDVLNRVVEIEKEISAVDGGNAVPYFWYRQDVFPYWTNRIGDITIEDAGHGEQIWTITLTMRLVIAHLTSGYAGENEDMLYRYIPDVLSFFREHPQLQSQTIDDGLDHVMDAFIGSCRGYSVFANSPAQQIGTEFELSFQMAVHYTEEY
jgi:hypothetical protein